MTPAVGEASSFFAASAKSRPKRRCTAQTRSGSCGRSTAWRLARDGSPDEVPDGRSPQVMRDPSRATGGDTGRAPSLRKTGNRLRLRLALALPDKPEEHAGRDDASALERFRSALRASSSVRRSAVMGNVLASPFFVLPASSLTSPASKSTWRYSSGSTSEAMRQPVT